MMNTRKWITRILAVGALGAFAAGVVPPTASNPPAAEAASLGAGGEFHPLVPTRIFDSRSPGINDTAPFGKKPASLDGADFDLQVTGLGGVPSEPTKVLAVVANVTVVEPEAAGWMGIRPQGGAPGSALVNFAAGRDVGNTAIVGVGPTGQITVRLRMAPGSRAHVVVDVSGWISTSSVAERGARVVPVGPARLVDTRNSGAPLRSDQTLAVKIRGANSYEPSIASIVPDRPTVSAVMVNIAAINWQPGSTATYVTATPSPIPPGTPATVANVNLPAGIVKTSMAIVPVGPDGNIYLRNHSGDLHVAVDILGYFESKPDESTAGRIVPLASPFRALDTRDVAFGNVPLGTGSVEDWSFTAFADSVTFPSSSGPVAQSALIGNLAATDLRRYYPSVPVTTYLTVYPADAGRPSVSNVNLAEGEVVPNMSLVKYGNIGAGPNAVKIYNHSGSVHYVLDVYAVVLS